MNELARVVEDPTAPVVFNPPPARADVDSWIAVVADVAKLADHIANTEFVPKGLRGNAPAAAAAILYGREVGLPPMTALSQTHVVEGRPAISAEAMRAMILAAGHELEFVETTGARCELRGRRRAANNWTTVVWSIDMARAAGLAGKPNWKAYPRQMLQARATAELSRLIFADVVHGFTAVEEAQDVAETPAAPGKASAPVQRMRATPSPQQQRPAELPHQAPSAESDGPPLPGEPERDPESEEGSAPLVSPGPSSPPQEDPSDSPAGDRPDNEARGDTGPAGDPPPPPPKPATQAQMKMIFAQLKRLGVDPDDDARRHDIASRLLDHKVESYSGFNRRDANQLNDTLARFETGADLDAFLDAIEQPQLEEPTDDGEPDDEEGDQ